MISYIPSKDPLYTKTAHHNIISKVISSGMFYPVFITGLSGNGKTMSVEQACSSVNRELVRVNITCETDEDDLLGGFRLLKGETVWQDGPVVLAMKRGAILLLDEVDLGSNKLLCLQSVMEGRGVFIKKTGVYVECQPGFNVIATANTKGQGDHSGKFTGTNYLNEAFLERFPLWLEQEYPTTAKERDILTKVAKSLELVDRKDNLIDALCSWSDQIRNSYQAGVISEIITTRRLVQIIKAVRITDNVEQSVKMCLNRFDHDTQEAFMIVFNQFYTNNPEESSEKIMPYDQEVKSSEL